MAAAAPGKHVLCEKPLCLTLAEATAASEAVASSGITLMWAHDQLFLPAVAKARDMIRAGALGKVYETRTTDSFLTRSTSRRSAGDASGRQAAEAS